MEAGSWKATDRSLPLGRGGGDPALRTSCPVVVVGMSSQHHTLLPVLIKFDSSDASDPAADGISLRSENVARESHLNTPSSPYAPLTRSNCLLFLRAPAPTKVLTLHGYASTDSFPTLLLPSAPPIRAKRPDRVGLGPPSSHAGQGGGHRLASSLQSQTSPLLILPPPHTPSPGLRPDPRPGFLASWRPGVLASSRPGVLASEKLHNCHANMLLEPPPRPSCFFIDTLSQIGGTLQLLQTPV